MAGDDDEDDRDDDEEEEESSKKKSGDAEDDKEEASKGKKSSKKKANDDEDEETPKKNKKSAKGKSKSDDADEPPKKSSSGMIFGLVGGGAAILLLCCCCGGGGYVVSTAQLKDAKWGVTPPEKEGPKISVTAEDLAKEVGADENAAKEKYKKRRVEVTGEVVSVMRGSIYLKGTKTEPTDKAGVTPLVSIKNKDHDKALRFGKGQKIKATGLCRIDGGNHVQIYDTEFSAEGPSTVIEVTAANLAQEYETSATAAQKKFRDKDIIVSGTIMEVQNFQVRLKGTAKTEVSVFVSDTDKVKELKSGQQVELRGRQEGYFKDQNSVSVSMGWILSAK